MITKIKEASGCATMDKILEEGIEQGDIESQKKDPLIEKAFEILSE